MVTKNAAVQLKELEHLEEDFTIENMIRKKQKELGNSTQSIYSSSIAPRRNKDQDILVQSKLSKFMEGRASPQQVSNPASQEKRNLGTVAYPCLEYLDNDPNLCNVCDEENNYYLFPRNSTHVLCAYGMWENYTCSLPSEYYPYDYEIFDTMSAAGYGLSLIDADTETNVLASFCVNTELYYMTSAGNFICDTFHYDQDVDDFGLASIYRMTPYLWCLDCQVSGYTNEVVQYIPQLGFYAATCTSDTPSCSYSQYTDDTTDKCVECSTKYKNCAACNSTDCILCYQNFFWNDEAYDLDTNSYTGQCLFNTCPYGSCANAATGQCETSDLDDTCLICTVETTGNQCSDCQPGYYLDDSFDCIQYGEESKTVSLYISNNYVLVDDGTTLTTDMTGQTPSDPYIHLQQALYWIASVGVDYNEMVVTIYVGKGDHFFFVCSGEEGDTMYGKNDTSDFVDQCSQYNLYRDFIKMDNVNITIQALECSMASTLGYSSNTAFLAMCVDLSTTSKPTIYVKNLIFSGLNAFAIPQTRSYDLSVYPVKLCQLSKTPDGTEGTISLSKTSQTKFTVSYKCSDPSYTGSYIPTSSSETTKCLANENDEFSSTQESSLGCSGEPTDDSFFEQDSTFGSYYHRRKTLFNLYAFSDINTVRNKTPELYIENCEFEYFYKGYESLVNVETNDLNVVPKSTFLFISGGDYYDLNNYVYKQQDRGARINVTSSNFKHSRFCKGMIVYRKAPFEHSSLSFLNLTTFYRNTTTKLDTDSHIILYKSTFTNLNSFSNVSALAIYGGHQVNRQLTNTYDPVNVPAFMHKGIVLNVEDFGGRIEIIGCTFTKNMHFIPSIFYGHQSIALSYDADRFKDTATKEYQLTKCDKDTNTDQYFFQRGISQTDDIDSYFDSFERLGTIYISRNQDKVIIKDNTFTKNIGTFGGAITINSPNWKAGKSPYMIINNNNFKQNMAYMSGNAIYIRNTNRETELSLLCAGVTIQNNEFIRNIGMKIHNGGAISATCQYLSSTLHQDYNATSGYQLITAASSAKDKATTLKVTSIMDGTTTTIEKYKFNIEDNNFEENFSGMKGTAVYLRQISVVKIDNCTFLSNGPVYSSQEFLYSPYTALLSSRSMTFYDDDCFDEYEYLSTCNNEVDHAIIWPRVQGAVHVIFCQTTECLKSTYTQALTVTSSYFTLNQAGPILDSQFSNKYSTSSQIFISGGFNNYIENSDFFSNKGDYTYFPNTAAMSLTKYFPDSYFLSAQSPLISVYIDPAYSKNYTIMNTTVYNSRFYKNKHTQVVGLDTDQQYFGSMIQAINYNDNATNYLPLLNIVECDFKDNQFVGPNSAMFYAQNMVMRSKSSTYINNGYLTTTTTTKAITDLAIGSTFNNLKAYSYPKAQYYGLFWMKGDIVFPNSTTHQFISNTYNFIFSQYGTVYAAFIDNQYLYAYGNTYKYLFAQVEGSLMVGSSSTGRSTILMDNENMSYLYSGEKGAITLKPAAKDLMSIYVNNTYITNVQAQDGSAFYLDKAAKVTLNNVIITQTNFPKDIQVYVTAQFKAYSYTLTTYADSSVIKQLTNSVVQKTGYIYIESASNTKAVMFGNKTIVAANYTNIGYAEALDCDFMHLSAQQSAVIESHNSKVRFANAIDSKRLIFNNTVTKVGPIGMYESSTFVGVNLNILNNTSKAKASAFYMSGSEASFTNASIKYNYASDAGTMVIESNSVFTCSYCSFISNYAYDSSGILAYNNIGTTIKIANSQFLLNTAAANLMTFLYSQVDISSTSFIDNIAQRINHGITMVSSKATMTAILVNYTNTKFIQNNDYLAETCFFSLNYQSTLTLTYSTVLNCRGANAGFLSATGSSTVSMSNTALTGIKSKKGAVIQATMAKSVTLKQMTFIDNSLVDVGLESTKGTISNSVFQNTAEQSIKATSGALTITDNTFEDGSNLNIYGKGVYCSDCTDFSAEGNMLKNLSSAVGGAMYLQGTVGSTFSLKRNQFLDNQAQQGAGLYIMSGETMTLSSNSFLSNTAEVIDPATTESAKLSKALGGAIFYACSDDDIKAASGCSLTLNLKNIFQNNYATDGGGAIQRTSTYAYIEDGTNTYINNTAITGTSDTSSYPKYINVQFLTDEELDAEDKAANGGRLLTSNELDIGRNLQGSEFSSVVSGKPFSFNVYIMDNNNENYTQDSSSTCTLAYIGTSSSVKLSNNVFTAKRGVYKFRKTVVTAPPKADMKFKFNITGIENFDADSLEDLFSSDAVSFAMTVRECIAGEEYTDNLECKVCEPGYYLYDAPVNVTYCKECPDHATCFGQTYVAPQDSYWRSTNRSDNFILCENVDACLEGDKNNPMGICAPGYKGVICGDCADGYSKTKPFECAACPERARNIVLMVVIFVFAAVIVFLLTNAVLNSTDHPKPMYASYLKIITNHFQVLYCIANMSYKWPQRIDDYESNHDLLSHVSESIFSFDCFFLNEGRDSDIIPVYYQKLILYGLMPIGLCIIDLLFWFIVCTVRGLRYRDLTSKIISTLVVMLFLVYPNVTKAMFMSFDCIEIEGVYRLKSNIESICYTGDHLNYIFWVTIPSVSLWALGIPFTGLVALILNRKSLFLMDQTTIMVSEYRQLRTVKIQLGFLLAGYRVKTFFWEIMILYRKLGIIIATVFLSTLSNEAQVLTVMMIIVTCLIMQLKFKPYYSSILNNMESYSLLVAAVTLFAGMYYVTGTHYSYMNVEGLQWFFLVFIVTPNVIFILYWLYYLRVEFLKQVYYRKQQNPIIYKIFKYLACTSMATFEKQYIYPDQQVTKELHVVPDGELDREKRSISSNIPDGNDASKDLAKSFDQILEKEVSKQYSKVDIKDISLDVPEQPIINIEEQLQELQLKKISENTQSQSSPNEDGSNSNSSRSKNKRRRRRQKFDKVHPFSERSTDERKEAEKKEQSMKEEQKRDNSQKDKPKKAEMSMKQIKEELKKDISMKEEVKSKNPNRDRYMEEELKEDSPQKNPQSMRNVIPKKRRSPQQSSSPKQSTKEIEPNKDLTPKKKANKQKEIKVYVEEKKQLEFIEEEKKEFSGERKGTEVLYTDRKDTENEEFQGLQDQQQPPIEFRPKPKRQSRKPRNVGTFSQLVFEKIRKNKQKLSRYQGADEAEADQIEVDTGSPIKKENNFMISPSSANNNQYLKNKEKMPFEKSPDDLSLKKNKYKNQ